MAHCTLKAILRSKPEYFNRLILTVLNQNQSVHSDTFKKLTLKASIAQRKLEVKGLHEAYETAYRGDNSQSDIKRKELEEEILIYLNISHGRAENLLSMISKSLNENRIPLSYIKQNVNLFKVHGVKFEPTRFVNERSSSFVMQVFTLDPINAASRLAMMKEATLPRTARNILGIHAFTNQHILYLQKLHLMDESFSPNGIFQDLKAPPNIMATLPTPKEYTQWTLMQLWNRLMEILLKWRLCPEDTGEFKQFQKMYNGLKDISEAIDMLTHQFGIKFDEMKIHTSYRGLLYGTANLKLFAEDEDPEMKKFVKHYPNILMKPYHDVKAFLEIVKYIKGSCPLEENWGFLCFKMSPQELLRRVEILINTTSLVDLQLTPRCYTLIDKIDMCFKNLRKNGISLDELECFPSIYLMEQEKEFVQTTTATTTVGFLNSILSTNISTNDLKIMHLVNIPEVTCMKKNVIFLLNEGFQWDELRDCYQILVFPHDIVVENYSNMNECPYAQEFRRKKEPHKLLQLLLYYTSNHYRDLGGSY